MTKRQRSIYRFKVTLLDIEPEIWRLIEVPESYTFWELHVAIQDAMGWLDYHLHAFDIDLSGRHRYPYIGIPESEMDQEYVPGWQVPITDHFEEPRDRARYDYDFGDGWEHIVELVAINTRQTGMKYPRCIDGARACPVEDCGGSEGYYELLDILADPDHDEYRETIHWLKNHAKNYFPYRPDEFNPAAVKFSSPYRRWKKMME